VIILNAQYRDGGGISLFVEAKNHTVLIVDPNRALAFSVPFQLVVSQALPVSQ
jgi:hypothetical protein